MLTLQIKEKEIESLTPEEEFIRGTVGAKCQINFDEFWQGYEKYIVFKRVGYEPINIMVDSLENEIEIPYTILAEIGEFKIGVFGITETETLPTLYSKDIKILYGTDTHGTTPPTYTPSEIDQLRLLKQDKLVSGENIKTINGESVLGKGNIKVQVKIEVDPTYTPTSENAQSGKAVAEAVAIEQKRSDNTFANALKSSKSGSAILIDDVSPLTHDMTVKISSDTVTDLTAVKVFRLSKNLIPLPYSQLPIGTTALNGIEFTVYEDGSILMNGTATTSFARYLYNNKQDLLGLRAGDIITGSKWVSDDSQIANFNLTFNYYNIDGDMKEGVINLSSQQNLTTTITEDYVGWGIYIYISSGKTFDNLLFKPQLELGETATDYEPYVEPTEYTPNADGTVDGVSSLYPNTTLMTDTEGVIITCEYNKDINTFSGVDVRVPTKTSELINDSNFATQDYVDEEIANFDFIKIVTELPETGLINRTYFVPKSDPTTNDLYDEYMWVDGKWELIATKQIEVDLTNYYTKSEVDEKMVVDQTYDKNSQNAQSGKAVAEAIEDEKSRADNTFSNALKSSKSGSAILIDDISSVTHEMSVKISSDTVTDLTAVKVTRCGKNLIQTNIIEDISPTGVNDLIWQGHISGKLSFSLDNSEYTPNPGYGGAANFKFVFGDGTVKYLQADGQHTYIETPSPLKEIYFVNWGRGTGDIKNIQLEIGSSKTDYEPYVEPTEYTPNADGTVEGVSSLYPNTTLMTDTDGVIITCEYNRDINKAFAELQAAIISLGGNI